LRPDFDPSIHKSVTQTGFSIIEEEKEEVKYNEDGEESIASSAVSKVITGQKCVSSGVHVNPSNLDEDQIDKQFF
jgi:hypothetical protein